MVEKLPNLVMMGLEEWSCCNLRLSRSDVTFRTVPDIALRGAGSIARSSIDGLWNASQM